ncbi:cyclin-dependent kinase inhibitor far1 [Entomortierella beljakovae]|nr:cyclin-dependent kinase inhibitor far1 [Entomortierella beljakovae]
MTSIIDASNAREFYFKNNVIFLTGGSGYVGITILEKILRTLSQVEKVYLLLRVSSKSTVQERLEEVANNRVFETLRSDYPTEELFREKIISKIIPIQGDVSLDNFGMSPENMKMVQSDTSVFIHSAATVRFDEPLHIPFNMNILGTKRGLDIASGMPHLASFVHISTAYLIPYGHPPHCPEKITPFLMGDHEKIFNMLSNMTKKEMDVYGETEVLKLFPTTYMFSKALTERLIKSWYKDIKFPIVIVRPTGDTKMDYVPVDYVSKITLSAAVAANRSAEEPVVFHAGISHINPIKLSDVGNHLERYWRSVPPPRKRSSNDIRCEYYPIEVFDKRFEKRFGSKIRAAEQAGNEKTVQDLKWLYAKSKVYLISHSNNWIFEANNTIQLDESATDELYCGLKNGIDWDIFMPIICYGTHKYLLGENVELPSKAQRRKPVNPLFTPRL